MTQKMEVRIVKLEDAAAAIMSKLVDMDKRLTGMDSVIRGNGTPGLVTKIETQGQRIRELETTRRSWKDFAVLSVSGGLVASMTALMQHFIR